MVTINLKIPAKVKTTDEVVKRLGGIDTLTQAVHQIHKKLSSKQKLDQVCLKDIKHKLKLELTADCQVPLQTKKS